MGESRGEQAGSVLVAVVMFDTNVVERIFDISHRYLYQYFSECFRTRSPIRVVDCSSTSSSRVVFGFAPFWSIPPWRLSTLSVPPRGAMAERRVLALLGPCRVNGVGGGVSSEDLQWLHVEDEDFDAFHDDFTSVALVAALGRLRDAVVAASHAAADAAWSPLGLSAPSARFACCSWWPDLPLPSVAIPAPAPTAKAKRRSGGMPSPVDRASPDQRWLDPARAEIAFAFLSSAAERVAVDGPYEVLTPAKAAARAVALLDAPENALANANTDVAWIVAGVDGSGGGSGGGVWPPEAVAAHGVLLAARRAGARAVVVVLTPPDASRRGDDDAGPSVPDGGEGNQRRDGNHGQHRDREGGLDAPRLILDVASRAGAEVIVLPADPRPSSSPSTIFFDPGERWRGALTIPSRDGGVRATLPGFRITSGDARRDRDASDPVAAPEPRVLSSFDPRASGDATLVEVVRLEVIPRECLCDRSAPLRVVADAHADATTIATLDALTEATRASSPGATPAFVVRVPHLATDDGHKNARRSAMTSRSSAMATNVPPPPHDRGALLLIRADGEGGFEARAFASVPTLLRRAASIARAAAPSVSVLDDEVTADGGGAATPASVASTGRKRKRARRGGGDSRGDGETRTSGEADAGRRERPGLDSEDDATESAETTELALKSVAVMDVNPSLAHALGAARGDGNGDDDGDEDGEKDAMGAATAANEGAPGTPSSAKNGAAIWIPTTRVEPARCSSGRERHPPFTRVLDALVRRREAEEARVAACPFGPPSSQPVAHNIPDRPFLTDALLRAARDVAAGRDVVRAAVRDAREEETSAERDAANAERAAGSDENVAAGPDALAIARDASRSRSKSGASPSREIPAVGPPMDWAAAERELQERVQRERRERRERQRMTMAPRHVPARRRTGNTILAAATGRGGGGGGGGVGGVSRAGGANVGAARAGGQAKSGVGSPPGGSRVEPSESAVGAGAAAGGADARRARVCTHCHIELAPIPGMNMNLMKHCYACGGAL